VKFRVIPTEKFKKQAKKLLKKYPSLLQELTGFSELLSSNPESGIPLGNNCYKIRISIRSKGRGKRSGARIITFLVREERDIYLLTIYDKSEISNISDKQISLLIGKIVGGSL